jgi:hypothetical protein
LKDEIILMSDDLYTLATTVLNYQWTALWSNTAPSAGMWVADGSIFLGYAGGGFAFCLAVLGAIQNAAQTIYWVEDAIDDWLKGFSKDKYEEVLADADKSETM